MLGFGVTEKGKAFVLSSESLGQFREDEKQVNNLLPDNLLGDVLNVHIVIFSYPLCYIFSQNILSLFNNVKK